MRCGVQCHVNCPILKSKLNKKIMKNKKSIEYINNFASWRGGGGGGLDTLLSYWHT